MICVLHRVDFSYLFKYVDLAFEKVEETTQACLSAHLLSGHKDVQSEASYWSFLHVCLLLSSIILV